MKKLFSLLVLVGLLLATPVSGMTPQEVLKSEGKRAGAFQCSEKQVIGMIDSLDEMWKIFLNPRNGKIIMIEADTEGNVVRVIFGIVSLVKKELKLDVQSEMSVEDAQKYFPDPCDFLAPREV